MAIRVVSFVFAVSFTLINEENDKLIIDGTTYTVTHGNYNALKLKTHILSLLPAGYGLDFDQQTVKYTFSYTFGDFTINKESTCLLLLGFTEGQDHASVGNELTSDRLADLSGVNEIYIDIPNILTSNISSKSGQKTSIVKSIPISVPVGSIRFYENNTSSFAYIQQQFLSFFHIRILKDDMSTPVDFNGVDWNMTLEVFFVPNTDQSETARSDYKQLYDSYVEKVNKN